MKKKQSTRLVAKIHVFHAYEAANHQPCTSDQDHCKSDLQRHEEAPHPSARQAACHGTFTGLQRWLRVAASIDPGRAKTEDKGSQQRHEQAEDQDSPDQNVRRRSL